MIFEQFRKWNIAMTWTLINIGADFIDYEYRIKQNEIWEYACDLAADNNDNPLLVRLMIADNTVDFFLCLA